MIGQSLSNYRIIEKIGSGGMGVVYLAHDTKLDRDVAIKVLPEAFADDKERLARFEREARLLASLNHPNIATLFDLQESDGLHFLVLEFVPGETLAERIAKGPIPVDEALPFFKQIAEALEAAHGKGIIHRDLKPANIKLTPEGQVKVLDFGLAKAFGDETPQSDLSESPTATRPTQAGVILGTAPYMSPEQARGKSVDNRTDIWAFGCVLYEALTSRKPFDGETVTDIFAAIINKEPDLELLPETLPRKIGELLRRCLRKDTSRRLQHIGDARVEIEDAMGEPSASSSSDAALVPRPKARVASPVVSALVAALVSGVAVWSLIRSGPEPPQPVKRMTINLPSTDPMVRGGTLSAPEFALSPNGNHLVYVGIQNGIQQLYLRPLDRLEFSPIAGTEGASVPFFSLDGDWIGFFADGDLKKVSLAGGLPVTLCSVYGLPMGVSWSTRGAIYFASLRVSGLQRVSDSGGEPEVITTVDPTQSDMVRHFRPEVLPGGEALLFEAVLRENQRSIALLLLETGEQRVLIEEGQQPRYTSSGHILYVHRGSLIAIPFDLEQLELVGSPVPVLEGVQHGGLQSCFSNDGSLAYVLGETVASPESSFVWVDRQGMEETITETLVAFQPPRISPDGKRLVFGMDTAGTGPNIWTLDLARPTSTRLGKGVRPIWSTDGEQVFFASEHVSGRRDIFSIPADGSGEAQQLTTGAYCLPAAVSSDGKILISVHWSEGSGLDIGTMRLDKERESELILQTAFDEHSAVLSPDDRWIAYVSDESGRNEVYLRPFPGAGGRWKVSTEGGSEPMWAPDGKEIFYRIGDQMMAVPVITDPDLALGQPVLLFEGRYRDDPDARGSFYDVSSDGRRFLMIKDKEDQSSTIQINVVLNWFEELKRRAPRN
jgi:serine/threonine-protein kinase